MNRQSAFEIPLFALGFRAFFAFAGLSALVLIVLWKHIYFQHLEFENYFPITFWHAHEMLLGYTSAVIAGFLLTAVKNWTGLPTLTGDRLAGLCLLWLYGRILPFYSGWLPDALIALVDFSFLPVLAYQIAKPIWRVKQLKSLVFIGLLVLMILGNGLIHAEITGLSDNTAWVGIQLVLATIILLILVIAGRIIPFFTDRGLPGTLSIRNPAMDIASVASAALVFILQLYEISGVVMAVSAIAAAGLNFLRVRNWYEPRVWYVPLLWVLYAGYGWIIIGFVLYALSAFSLVMPTLSLHAFTMGGIGVLTLGMMSRVALGHTGRALKASGAITIGFIMINLAVFVRVLMPIVAPAWYGNTVTIATSFWLMAFSLFAFVYAPILVNPRIDGKPG